LHSGRSLPPSPEFPGSPRRLPVWCHQAVSFHVEFAQRRAYLQGDAAGRGAFVTIHFHQNDLPAGLNLGPVVAIDTETMGLDPRRDRLCVVQLSAGDGHAHVVQIARGQTSAPNLERLLSDPATLKLFHFGRFDVAALKNAFGVVTAPVWCTKIASRLVRTFTDRHGLKYLLLELVGVDVSKQQQTSDWGAEKLTEAQLEYAASDVLYLHRLKAELEIRLIRENRLSLAQRCFDFLPTRAELDLMGYDEPNDLFHH
jgi:ribonuclease D